MPLKRLKNDHRITTWRGVWTADEAGCLVLFRISHIFRRCQAPIIEAEGSAVGGSEDCVNMIRG